MPAIERPPVSPEAQAQMGPPGGPNFGPGMQQMQQQMDKSPEDIAVATCEKILMGVQNEAFRAPALKAIAQLKLAAAQAQQKQPQSMPPGKGPEGAPQPMPMPPMQGAMAG